MKIYNTTCKEGYEDLCIKNYNCINDWTEELKKDYSIKSEWPSRVELEVADRGKKSDIPFLWSIVGALVISAKVKGEMKDFFCNETVELLPMYLGKEIYYLVHIIHVDELDIEFLEDRNGRIQKVFNKKEIEEKKINNRGIFRIFLRKDKPSDTVYITEKFADKVRDLDLKGVKFKVIWDSEEDYSDSRE